MKDRWFPDDESANGESEFALRPNETTVGGAPAAETGELAIRRRAKLVMLGGETPGRIFLLREIGNTLIGRDMNADVRVTAGDTSRRHALLIADGQHDFTLKDLGSRNGTLINGIPLKGSRALHYGDRVQLGAATSFVFTYHDTADEQLTQLQKLDAIGQVAGNVAHDFNNLLFVIASCIEALEEDGCSDEARAEIYRDLHQAVDSGRARTEQLLSFMRRDGMKRELLDLRGPVSKALELFRHTLNDSFTLTTDLESAPIEGNHNALEQALYNLLTNARDATPKGGRILVRLKACPTSPMATLMPQGPLVQLTVEDEGTGMDEATRQRIFEPFFTTKVKGKGTGLGLASVFGTVRSHGGQIQVESEPGQGTIFRIFLPMSQTEDLDRPSSPQNRATNHSGHLRINEAE